MPYVNGRFYINPSYGRDVERARVAENLARAETPRDNEQWVTIHGRHVLIQDSQGKQSRQSNADTRHRIAEIAEMHDGSTDWAYAKRKGNFPPNTDKCNKYVYDVTKEAGAEATTVSKDGSIRAPLAAEWADPNTKIANWNPLGKNETPQAGDVAAYKLPGGGIRFSGHSGIVTSVDPDGTVHAEAAHRNVIGSDDSFNPGVRSAAVTYRRFTGGLQ